MPLETVNLAIQNLATGDVAIALMSPGGKALQLTAEVEGQGEIPLVNLFVVAVDGDVVKFLVEDCRDQSNNVAELTIGKGGFTLADMDQDPPQKFYRLSVAKSFTVKEG